MNRYYPDRNTFGPNGYSKFLAFFWLYLLTIFLLSFWP